MPRGDGTGPGAETMSSNESVRKRQEAGNRTGRARFAYSATRTARLSTAAANSKYSALILLQCHNLFFQISDQYLVNQISFQAETLGIHWSN